MMVTLRSRALGLAGLLGLVALAAPTPALAQQDAPTGIYYDYAQVTIGGVSQFVLVPRPTDAFRSDAPPQVSIPDAFRVLRENKQTTYGNASLTLTDDDIAQGRVVVHIDPEQQQWFQIVAAETVYTFTGLGMTEVVFPGVSDEPWTRAQVPFAAFVLHVPMWRALPPAHMDGAVIELFDGSSLPSAEFYQRWGRGDRDLQAQVLRYLAEGEPLEQRGVIGVLGQVSIPGADQAVIATLGSDDASVRLAAIDYLAAHGAGMDRLAALVQSDPDADVRNAAAQALGQSGDTHYAFFELQHNLETAAAADVPAAIAALAASGDARAVDLIVPYVSNDDATVRAAASDALLSMGAGDRLAALLEAQDTTGSVRLEVAHALADHAQGAAHLAGVEYLLTTSAGSAALELLEQINESQEIAPDARREILERELGHPEREVRLAAAGDLAAAGAAESLPALAQAAGHESDADVVDAIDRAAVQILVGLPLDRVREYAEGHDVFLKRAAFRALGQLASQGQASDAVFRMLRAGLSDSEAAVRGAAILGLAAQANDEAFQAIQIAAADASPAVRRDVAHALAHFPAGQGTSILVGFMDDADPSVAAAALDTLGARGESDYLAEVTARVDAPAAAVRAAAVRAMGELATPDVAQAVIDRLMGATNDPEPEVRSAAADALARFDNDLAIQGISPLTQDRDMDVRLAAIAALGHSHYASAEGLLENLLDDRDASIRAHTADALGELGRAEALPALQNLLSSETDPMVTASLQQAIQRLGGSR